MSKSANYRIRVEPDLHQDFLDACDAQNVPAAQVIRKFMREYVKEHKPSMQPDLFVAEPHRVYGREEQ